MTTTATPTRPRNQATPGTPASSEGPQPQGSTGRPQVFDSPSFEWSDQLTSRDLSEFQRAIARLLDQLGSALVIAERAQPGDVPIRIGSTVIGYAKSPSIAGYFARLVQQLEREFGSPLPKLSRIEKQHAVRRFEEEGALELREAVDRIAAALCVSRVTVYGYLNRRQP